MPSQLDHIERAYAGNRKAGKQLLEHLLPVIQLAIERRLYPLAKARARDPLHDRDDFVSGVWLRLLDDDWRLLRNYDPRRGSLEAYVARIAERHVIGVFRIKSRDPYNELPMPCYVIEEQGPIPVSLEHLACARAELEQLYAFLRGRLDRRGLLLFDMLEVRGMSVDEACERVAMSRDAAYQWRARFRRLVRQWRGRSSGGAFS